MSLIGGDYSNAFKVGSLLGARDDGAGVEAPEKKRTLEQSLAANSAFVHAQQASAVQK